MPAESAPSATAGRDPAQPDTIDLGAIEPPGLLDRARDLVGGDWRSAVGGGMALVVVAVLGWVVLRPDPPRTEDVVPLAVPSTPDPSPPVDRAGATTTAPTGPLLVHAAGAVVAPGLYELPAGRRVADLVQAAGGAAPGADLDRLNLAEPLVDGSRVYVPTVGEAEVPEPIGPTGPGGADAGGPAVAPAAVPGSVDLNTATLEQLDELPGIGPTTAQAIIDHRTANGPFPSVDGLLDVRGIGEAKLADLRDLVTVG